MPIYEYLCQDCAYTFELKQSMKEEAVAVCTRCGKSVGRIISAPAIMFKGSGWYVTDYSDKLKPPTEESPAPAAGAAKEAATGTSASATAATPAASTAAPAPSTAGGTGTSAPSSTPSPSTGGSSSGST